MTTTAHRPPPRRELGRLLVGAVLELVVTAYGVGAATAVALSPTETVAGKGQDALAAVPSLEDRYRAASYVVRHRQEIQDALDYVNTHTVSQEELERSVAQTSATLRDIETTYDEADRALDAFFSRPTGFRDLVGLPVETIESVRAALRAKPELGDIRELADRAEQVQPYLDEVQVLVPVYQGNLVALVDNFARDEIADTLLVMAAALALAFVLARTVGFWARRGRPGLVARTLQRWGARVFRRWYVRHLPYALGDEVYDAARERLHSDLVRDPRTALSPDAYRELERHFTGARDRRLPG